MGEKIAGKIKWYNAQRGFGLISGSDGKEYFVHSSQLSFNVGEIRIGTQLIFEATPRPAHKGGYEATQVELYTSPLSEHPKPNAGPAIYVDGKPYTLKGLAGKNIYSIDRQNGNIGGNWTIEGDETWLFYTSYEFSFSAKIIIDKGTICVDKKLYRIKELEGKKICWYSSDLGHTGGSFVMNEGNFIKFINGPYTVLDLIDFSFPKEDTGAPITQLSKSSTLDSGADYWYQSYATTTNNQSSTKKPIETKVVGVTYEGRQSIVALLSVGEEVELIREPDNPYDKNAIRVVRKTGQCFGFLSKFLAVGLAPKFDAYGKPIDAVVISITRGYSSDSNIGVTIQFNLPEISDKESDLD